MKILTIITLFSYTLFVPLRVYAQQASSLPVELQVGTPAPFTGLLLSLELGKKMMQDSQLSLKVPLLEQLNTTNDSIITQQKIQISSLQDDKKALQDANSKIISDDKASHKYDSWIYAGFFAGGILVAIGLVLVTGYALEKVGTKNATVQTTPVLKF